MIYITTARRVHFGLSREEAKKINEPAFLKLLELKQNLVRQNTFMGISALPHILSRPIESILSFLRRFL